MSAPLRLRPGRCGAGRAADHPAHAAVIITVIDGSLTNKLAREVVDGVLDGEGEPAEIVEKRGLAVVKDEFALYAAVDEAPSA